MSKQRQRLERERKFLVKRNPPGLRKYTHGKIAQGYLAHTSDRIEVRVRRYGRKHTLTVKKSKGHGRTERFELEIPITSRQFGDLWPLTEGRRVHKTRYRIPFQEWKIELDVYGGKLRGLKTAEVEFKSAADQASFSPPKWFGREISRSKKYSNWNLAKSGLKST